MKGGLRLAQSLGLQSTEKIGIFKDFSSLSKTFSGTSKKRDSEACSASQKRVCHPRNPSQNTRPSSCDLSRLRSSTCDIGEIRPQAESMRTMRISCRSEKS